MHVSGSGLDVAYASVCTYGTRASSPLKQWWLLLIDWLIVHFKEVSPEKLKQSIADLTQVALDKLSFLTIGSHHGTNEFSNVSNVIITGLNRYRPIDYQALYRACGNLKPETPISKTDLLALENAELDHFIYQAACRGSVRRCIDGQAAPCNLHIISAQKRYVLDSGRLNNLFPGCAVVQAHHKTKPVSERQQRALDHIQERLAQDHKAVVPFNEVQERVRVADNSNFRKWVRQNEAFQLALAQLGYEEQGRSGHDFPVGFVSKARHFDIEEGGFCILTHLKNARAQTERALASPPQVRNGSIQSS